MEMKDTLSLCSNSEEQQMQDKSKESCMKFIKPQFSLDDDDGLMTRKYFLAYTQTEVQQFCNTLIQHMKSVKKSIDERAMHKRDYDSRVNDRQMLKKEGNIDTSKALDASLVITESSETEFEKQDTNRRSGNDADADDADIKPIYDKEPMAEPSKNQSLDAWKRHWLPKKPTVTLDSLRKTKARMKMITITKVKEMETMVTIMEMEIKTEGMEVQKEMHQLLGFVTITIFSIVNHATLVTIGINESYEIPWKDLMKLMIEVYCPRIKIQKMANGLMDQIVRVYAARNVEQKRKFENNPWGNRVQQLPFKRQNVIQAVTVGHMARNCRTVVSTQEPRDSVAASNDARGRRALGGGDGNPDSNVMTDTFLLNNLYAYILFDYGANRSFVSTMFSALIDIPPTVGRGGKETDKQYLGGKGV
nr:hypothetical protein [Tanacetum cinerariifolium]